MNSTIKEKICPRCNLSKNVNEFSKAKDKKDGLQYSCKKCDAKRTHNIWFNNKEKYRIINGEANKRLRKIVQNNLKELKQTKKCEICNESDPSCLDFDHIDPKNKKMNISKMISSRRSWKNILKEIEKCQVLCVNCHRMKDNQIKPLKNERDKFRYNQRLKINEYKEKIGCNQCGFNKCGVALDFHHKNRSTKVANIGYLVNRKWETIQMEIDKCEVLCGNCHRKLHAKERK